jgi:hypothetical protein
MGTEWAQPPCLTSAAADSLNFAMSAGLAELFLCVLAGLPT